MAGTPYATGTLEAADGPGALTWAWGVFAAALICLAAFIQFNDWSAGSDAALNLSLEREPERFARPGPEALRARPAPLEDEETLTSAPRSAQGTMALPSVRAARPGEFDGEEAAAASAAMSDAGETADTASSPDGAAVIRVSDLPAAGEAAAAGTGTLRIAGAPPAVPDPALFRPTGSGPYPRIADDGRRPSRAYARSYAATQGAPRIGLIVSGLGLSPELTAGAIANLPPEATLAFAPYAKDIGDFAARARAAGHETMIELPMEAPGADADRLGPAALMTAQTREDNLKRLDWMLTRYAGYFGVTSYLGAGFNADRAALAPVLERLKASGVAYVSDNPAAGSDGLSGFDYRRTDFVLSGGGDLSERLAEIEQAARARGGVLVKVYATPEALPALADWAGGLKERGIAIAPASALIE